MKVLKYAYRSVCRLIRIVRTCPCMKPRERSLARMGLWCPDAQTPSPASSFACNWPDLITTGRYMLKTVVRAHLASPCKPVFDESSVLSS